MHFAYFINNLIAVVQDGKLGSSRWKEKNQPNIAELERRGKTAIGLKRTNVETVYTNRIINIIISCSSDYYYSFVIIYNVHCSVDVSTLYYEKEVVTCHRAYIIPWYYNDGIYGQPVVGVGVYPNAQRYNIHNNGFESAAYTQVLVVERLFTCFLIVLYDCCCVCIYGFQIDINQPETLNNRPLNNFKRSQSGGGGGYVYTLCRIMQWSSTSGPRTIITGPRN